MALAANVGLPSELSLWGASLVVRSVRRGSGFGGRVVRLQMLLCVLIACCGNSSLASEECWGGSTALVKFERFYGIRCVTSEVDFRVTTAHGQIDGRSASPKDVASYVPILMAEWKIYPADLIARTRLRQIVMCSGLAFAGQLRTAVPDFENDTLYLDVSRGRDNEIYTRKVIHHELFHVIDLKDDQELYTDARWACLNDASFRYRSGGVNAQGDPDTSVLSSKRIGFLNDYSTTGVEEDKAEVFATMIVENEIIEQRANTDSVLREKMALIKRLLVRFCPQADVEFWMAAQSVAR